MKVSNNELGNIAMVAIAVVAGLVIGFAGGSLMNKDKKDTNDKSTATTTASTQGNVDGVTVGGAKMVRTKDIVDNAVNAKNVTTVVAAVKAADLVDTLKSEGPFTVFAPNNTAFAALPAGTLDTLLKPENKEALVSILTYHVVPGTYTTAALRVMASKGETLKTVQGDVLTPVMVDNELQIQDAKGNSISIETPDVISSNGVTHVIKSVLMHS